METHSQPATRDSGLKTRDKIALSELFRFFAQGTTQAYVQILQSSRVIPRRIASFDRPFLSVPAKTTALTTLVFQNESYVWSKRKNAGFVSKFFSRCP